MTSTRQVRTGRKMRFHFRPYLKSDLPALYLMQTFFNVELESIIPNPNGLMMIQDSNATDRRVAYSYVRMSTDKQLLGDSLRRQVERSERFAKENGLVLDQVFKLRDIGKSAFDGTNTEKGDLGKFLVAVKAGRIARGSWLIIESLDRLTRQSALPGIGIFIELLSNGITIATLMDNKVFHPETMKYDDLMYSVVSLTRAHEESLTKSRRVSEAWQQKRKRAGQQILTKRAVAWVQAKADRTGFDLIPDRVALVQRIFDQAANGGMGADMIARRFNRSKVPTFGRSNGWHKSYVLKILNNRAVLGEFTPTSIQQQSGRAKCDPVWGYYPNIIDEDLFYRAQAAMAARRQSGAGRKGAAISNLFSGILVCGVCCGRMHLLNKGEKGGGRVLVCDTARRGLGCYRVPWSYDDFETSFLTFVSEVDSPEFYSRDDTELSALTDRLATSEGALTRAKALRERVFNLIVGDEPTNYLANQLREADAAVAMSQDRVDKIKAEFEAHTRDRKRQVANVDLARGLIQVLRNASEADRPDLRLRLAAHIRAVVREILVWPGGIMANVEEREEMLSRAPDEEHRVALNIFLDEPWPEDRAMLVEFSDGHYVVFNPVLKDSGKANYVVRGSSDERLVGHPPEAF